MASVEKEGKGSGWGGAVRKGLLERQHWNPHSEEVPNEPGPKAVKEAALSPDKGRAFQAAGTAGAGVLRWQE